MQQDTPLANRSFTRTVRPHSIIMNKTKISPRQIAIVLCLISLKLGYSQVKLFSSDSISLSDWNFNQRKIVRSPELGIIAEANNEIFFSHNLNTPIKILNGKRASLAIDYTSNIHIVYANNGIKYSSTESYKNWTPSISISDSCEIVSYPIADCDKEGNVHVIYGTADTCTNNNYLSSLKYIMISDNQKQQSATIVDLIEQGNTDTIINYTLATHLLYTHATVFTAYQLSNDSIYLMYSANNGIGWKQITALSGSDPALSIGFGRYGNEIVEYFTFPTILYLDKNEDLINGHGSFHSSITDTSVQWYGEELIQNGPVDYLCIDDVVGPFGFSYIFQKRGVLYHAFSHYRDSEIIDTISNDVVVSSIAYKQFDVEKVDIIWFERNGDNFDMYYQWFEKIPFANNYIDRESRKLQFAAYPNPFTSEIIFSISSTKLEQELNIGVYTIEGKLLKKFSSNNKNIIKFKWDGTTDSGNHIESGIYIVNVISGNISLTRVCP